MELRAKSQKHSSSLPSALCSMQIKFIMKKILFILLSILAAGVTNAQMPAAITIEPPGATAYDELTLIFDPAEACFMSGSLAGLDSIAMHTGVTFITGEAWQHIIEFNSTGANGQSTTLLPTGDGRFSITYTPADFYGLSGEIITQICAVFNNGTNWNNDGRDFDGGGPDCMDFFIPINFDSPGQTIYIPWDYSTIQEGIDAAVDGDTVLVNEGWYFENINFLGKKITVASWYINTQNAYYISSTAIDGMGNGTVVTFNNSEDSTALLCGFTISNGNSTGDGGGIYCEGSGPTIRNCNIEYNTAVDGGGISCQYGASPTIFDCEIKSNYASLDGGGIYHEGNCSTVVSNCLFYDNNASDEGAGIYYEILCNSQITNCQFLNNTAGSYGGAVCCYNSILTLEGNEIVNNYAYAMGGGILAEHTDLIIENTEFVGNEAPGHAGALFYENTPGDPGNFEISFLNCSFENNTTDGACGGLLIGKEEGDESIINVAFDNCTFSGNTADRRTAMYLFGEDVNFTITNCIFEDNTATTYVAGISISAFCQGSIVNCLFDSNDAATGGEEWNSGGVSVWSGAEVNFINCTFADNTAAYGAGLTVGSGGIAHTVNTIFWGNSNGQLALDTYNDLGGILNIDYCDIQDGIDSVSISAESTLNWGDNNIIDDPMFFESGEYPYAISDGSPCIDAGSPDTTGLNLPDGDIINNLRIWDGDNNGSAIIDMGAYEFGSIPVGKKNERLQYLMFEVQCFPNPFNSSSKITFSLDQKTYTTLNVYNLNGQHIIGLIDEILPEGNHEVAINGMDLPAGIYFCQLKINKRVNTLKMIKY